MNDRISYSEIELIALLKSRDRQSFNYLYNNYSSALYNVVLQIISDRQTASDVLQNIFINIWRNIDCYDPDRGRLFTWMLNISHNQAIDMVRSKNYRNSMKNHAIAHIHFFDTNELSTELNIDTIGLREVVDKLKIEYRTLIELAYFQGHTRLTIAKMKNLPLGTVKSRLRFALSQLRSHLLELEF